jgi:hypothetical protein
MSFKPSNFKAAAHFKATKERRFVTAEPNKSALEKRRSLAASRFA